MFENPRISSILGVRRSGPDMVCHGLINDDLIAGIYYRTLGPDMMCQSFKLTI